MYDLEMNEDWEKSCTATHNAQISGMTADDALDFQKDHFVGEGPDEAATSAPQDDQPLGSSHSQVATQLFFILHIFWEVKQIKAVEYHFFGA